MSNNIIKKIVDTEKDVITTLKDEVERCSNEAIEINGRFTIGLSGGSLAKFLSEGLPTISTSWDKWTLFFCDERQVPVSSSDSTLKLYIDSLIGKTPLKEEQFNKVDTSLDVEASATDYENKLKMHFENVTWPVFDLLLLGMGPDGHTASLFPGHKLLQEKTKWIAAISDSPKPPPCRVTMTFPVINSAKNCIFAMAGSGKAEMVKRILKDGEDLPARQVCPTNGKLIWILDQSAASLL